MNVKVAEISPTFGGLHPPPPHAVMLGQKNTTLDYVRLRPGKVGDTQLTGLKWPGDKRTGDKHKEKFVQRQDHD